MATSVRWSSGADCSISRTAGAGLHPLGAPVVVVTHSIPEAWIERYPGRAVHVRHGGGVERAVEIASEIAGDGRTVGVAAGNVGSQVIDAGLADGLVIDLAPVVLGTGRPFFDGLGAREAGPPQRASRRAGRRRGAPRLRGPGALRRGDVAAGLTGAPRVQVHGASRASARLGSVQVHGMAGASARVAARQPPDLPFAAFFRRARRPNARASRTSARLGTSKCTECPVQMHE